MSYHQLTLSERRKIALMLKDKQGVRSIARELERSPSTISREIKRNITSESKGSTRKVYRYRIAHKKYRFRKEACREGKYTDTKLCKYVADKLMATWSPEQIDGRIKIDYPNDQSMRVSHSSIYRWLHKGLMLQAAQLKVHLRRHGHKHGERRGRFHGVRELNTRSKEVLRRKRVGDWEVDTIVSSNKNHPECLLSACDRKSRYCGLVLLKRRSAPEVMRGFHFLFGTSTLPLKTMTSDRGTEFACYGDVEKTWDTPFYFCRPHSPWQKPSVENQNGLIRQFFPKGTNFNEISPEQVATVMQTLNNRPRKCLGFKTPTEVLHFT